MMIDIPDDLADRIRAMHAKDEDPKCDADEFVRRYIIGCVLTCARSDEQVEE